MKKNTSLNQMKRFVGTWKCCDGFCDIEINIKLKTGIFTLSAIDRYDSEMPDIYDALWDESGLVLSFSIHWESTGRFTKYRFMPSLVNDRIEVTYTYTAQELWERA